MKSVIECGLKMFLIAVLGVSTSVVVLGEVVQGGNPNPPCWDGGCNQDPLTLVCWGACPPNPHYPGGSVICDCRDTPPGAPKPCYCHGTYVK